MSQNTETPQTTEQLTDGTQKASHQYEVTETPGQLSQLTNIPDSIRGLVADNARSLGSASTGQLMAAITSHFANELNAEKKKTQRLESKIDSMNSELTELKIDKGVLLERLGSLQSSRRLKNLIITMGSALFAYSTELLISEESRIIGVVMILAGTVLLVAGWLGHEQKDGK